MGEVYNADGVDIKRCNCSKTRCLKLYCACFAAGVLCAGCACVDCYNTTEHIDYVRVERTKILQRSPRAFAPKVVAQQDGNTAHKKGCRCRKSRCLKKYCECYDGGVACTVMCRCEDCANTTEALAARAIRPTSVPHVAPGPPPNTMQVVVVAGPPQHEAQGYPGAIPPAAVPYSQEGARWAPSQLDSHVSQDSPPSHQLQGPGQFDGPTAPGASLSPQHPHVFMRNIGPSVQVSQASPPILLDLTSDPSDTVADPPGTEHPGRETSEHRNIIHVAQQQGGRPPLHPGAPLFVSQGPPPPPQAGVPAHVIQGPHLLQSGVAYLVSQGPMPTAQQGIPLNFSQEPPPAAQQGIPSLSRRPEIVVLCERTEDQGQVHYATQRVPSEQIPGELQQAEAVANAAQVLPRPPVVSLAPHHTQGPGPPPPRGVQMDGLQPYHPSLISFNSLRGRLLQLLLAEPSSGAVLASSLGWNQHLQGAVVTAAEIINVFLDNVVEAHKTHRLTADGTWTAVSGGRGERVPDQGYEAAGKATAGHEVQLPQTLAPRPAPVGPPTTGPLGPSTTNPMGSWKSLPKSMPTVEGVPLKGALRLMQGNYRISGTLGSPPPSRSNSGGPLSENPLHRASQLWRGTSAVDTPSPHQPAKAIPSDASLPHPSLLGKGGRSSDDTRLQAIPLNNPRHEVERRGEANLHQAPSRTTSMPQNGRAVGGHPPDLQQLGPKEVGVEVQNPSKDLPSIAGWKGPIRPRNVSQSAPEPPRTSITGGKRPSCEGSPDKDTQGAPQQAADKDTQGAPQQAADKDSQGAPQQAVDKGSQGVPQQAPLGTLDKEGAHPAELPAAIRKRRRLASELMSGSSEAEAPPTHLAHSRQHVIRAPSPIAISEDEPVQEPSLSRRSQSSAQEVTDTMSSDVAEEPCLPTGSRPPSTSMPLQEWPQQLTTTRPPTDRLPSNDPEDSDEAIENLVVSQRSTRVRRLAQKVRDVIEVETLGEAEALKALFHLKRSGPKAVSSGTG